jgi:dolichol kinase
MIRDHEANGDFTGATYILLSVCFTIALYDKPIAIAALAFIIVGDTLAAIIGRKFGRHRFSNKSFEGSFACLAGTVVVAVLVWLLMPEFPLSVGLAGALVATVVEAMPLGVDDNVSVPLVSGLVMSLLMRIMIYS